MSYPYPTPPTMYNEQKQCFEDFLWLLRAGVV